MVYALPTGWKLIGEGLTTPVTLPSDSVISFPADKTRQFREETTH